MIVELLASDASYQRSLGADAARYSASGEGRDDVLPALLRAYDLHHDPSVLEALEHNDDARVVPALVEALDSSLTSSREVVPRGDKVFQAVAALERLGKLAEPALPRLAEVAASHWSARTRALAARAYGTIYLDAHAVHGDGETIEPGPPRCPREVRREPAQGNEGARWVVRLASETLELRDFSVVTAEGATCGAGAGAGRHAAATALGGECLTSDNGFECGGRLRVWRGGRATDLGYAHAGRFVPRSKDVLFLASCGHMVSSWSVESLTRGPAGKWERREIAGAMGSGAVAFAAEDGGAIDVLIIEDGWGVPRGGRDAECGARTHVEGDVRGPPFPTFVLLRISEEGNVTALE